MTECTFLNHETITVGSITFMNNPGWPIRLKLGLIGLFVNSLLSSAIPIPIFSDRDPNK
ncbi:MAG TPA: hypothetical protein VE971_00155 [Candidatus Eisenbacteria bacterium]|nr:hypothetical protein [Candidatus Eisenbacteria bacterium]